MFISIHTKWPLDWLFDLIFTTLVWLPLRLEHVNRVKGSRKILDREKVCLSFGLLMEELSHSQKLVGKLQISFCDMWEISCSYTSRWWYYLFFVNSLPDYFQSQQQGVAVEQWNPPTVCDFAPKSQIFGVIQLILDSVTIWIWVKLGDWCQGSVRFILGAASLQTFY